MSVIRASVFIIFVALSSSVFAVIGDAYNRELIDGLFWTTIRKCL